MTHVGRSASEWPCGCELEAGCECESELELEAEVECEFEVECNAVPGRIDCSGPLITPRARAIKSTAAVECSSQQGALSAPWTPATSKPPSSSDASSFTATSRFAGTSSSSRTSGRSIPPPVPRASESSLLPGPLFSSPISAANSRAFMTVRMRCAASACRSLSASSSTFLIVSGSTG